MQYAKIIDSGAQLGHIIYSNAFGCAATFHMTSGIVPTRPYVHLYERKVDSSIKPISAIKIGIRILKKATIYCGLFQVFVPKKVAKDLSPLMTPNHIQQMIKKIKIPIAE